VIFSQHRRSMNFAATALLGAALSLMFLASSSLASSPVVRYLDAGLGKWEIKPVGSNPTNKISPARTVQTNTRKGKGRNAVWISHSVSSNPGERSETTKTEARLLRGTGFRTRTVSGSFAFETWAYPGGRYVSVVKKKGKVVSRTKAKWSLKRNTLKVESKKRLADGKPEWTSEATRANKNKTISRSRGSSREWTTFVGRRIR
jgi:uncharacterized protein (DUF2147 family)